MYVYLRKSDEKAVKEFSYAAFNPSGQTVVIGNYHK